MLTSSRCPHHNQNGKRKYNTINLNAIIPNVCFSSFSYCIKIHKLPSYQMRQKAIHAKDLVLIIKWTDSWL